MYNVFIKENACVLENRGQQVSQLGELSDCNAGLISNEKRKTEGGLQCLRVRCSLRKV